MRRSFIREVSGMEDVGKIRCFRAQSIFFLILDATLLFGIDDIFLR